MGCLEGIAKSEADFHKALEHLGRRATRDEMKIVMRLMRRVAFGWEEDPDSVSAARAVRRVNGVGERVAQIWIDDDGSWQWRTDFRSVFRGQDYEGPEEEWGTATCQEDGRIAAEHSLTKWAVIIRDPVETISRESLLFGGED